MFVDCSGDATEIKLRDLKPSADYFVKYVNQQLVCVTLYWVAR